MERVAGSHDRNGVLPWPDHHIWFLVVPGVQPLDLVGPHEVFDAARRIAEHLGVPGPRYRLHVVGPGGGAIRGESGLAVVAEPLPGIDQVSGTVVVPGGEGPRLLGAGDDRAIAWLAAAARRADRVATVCTGAHLAAAAGLLDGRRVATHWAWADALAARCPLVDVCGESIWERDGELWSSAGVTAGIDLALAIVDADLGTEVAQLVAQQLVVFLRRPGGQSQFATSAWADLASSGPVRRAQELIRADPGADLTVDDLARRVGLSARHLTRLFVAELGETPARHVERVRLAAARHQLERGTEPVDVVALRCGFGTSETMRRTFHRRLGVSPSDYRDRFSKPHPTERAIS